MYTYSYCTYILVQYILYCSRPPIYLKNGANGFAGAGTLVPSVTAGKDLKQTPQEQQLHDIKKNIFRFSHLVSSNMPRGSGNNSSSSGYNSQGNHYNTPGGTNSSSGSSYHCELTKEAHWYLFCHLSNNANNLTHFACQSLPDSNSNGSYYYANDNGSTYYNSGSGSSTYTPSGSSGGSAKK